MFVRLAAAALLAWTQGAAAATFVYGFDHVFDAFSNPQAGMDPGSPGGTLRGTLALDDSGDDATMVADYALTSFLPGPAGAVWREADYMRGQTRTVSHPVLGEVTLRDSHLVLPHPSDPALRIVVLTDDRLDLDPSDGRRDLDNALFLIFAPAQIGAPELLFEASESYLYEECDDLRLPPECVLRSGVNGPSAMRAALVSAPLGAVPLPGAAGLLAAALAGLALRGRGGRRSAPATQRLPRTGA
ncbi:hypothetical protein [Oceanicella actignis]|uniref:hypothetical protein n=1 Tax=Oceanicella actignis TaxID=1189325 RepID=UPI0011E81B24|nr:hypothetical protein [Oceanicella actignis]TYO89166.1 hypothetical protein LY05_01782 [Oceanicella actignis]